MTCRDDPKGEKRSADVIGAAVLVATTAASVSALEHVCGTVVRSKLRRPLFAIADRCSMPLINR
jgi:hypothetical protein